MKKVIILLALVCGLFAVPAYAAEEAKAPEFEYYQVPPLYLPVITEKGLTQQVSLVVSLELPFGKKDEISAYGPRLVDAYIREMFGALASGQVMVKGNVLDIEGVRNRIATVTEKVLGKSNEHVKAVLLQAVQQHQI